MQRCNRRRHMADHRTASNFMQNFRNIGFHPGALTCGKQDGGEAVRHEKRFQFDDDSRGSLPRSSKVHKINNSFSL
jgi:hypothetical protein